MLKHICWILFLSTGWNALHALTWEQTNIEITPQSGETTATVHFKFTNKADAPVSIKKAVSSCTSCTELSWDEKNTHRGSPVNLLRL